MKESWQNLIDLIANPKATFTRLKSKPKVRSSRLLVFCFLVVLLAWMVFPFTRQFLNPQYASSLADIELLGSTRAGVYGICCGKWDCSWGSLCCCIQCCIHRGIAGFQDKCVTQI